MKTEFKTDVGTMKLVVRSDGGIYLGRPDDHGILGRECIRIGSSPGICLALAEALREAAEYLKLPPFRLEEEKPPAGHHAAPRDDAEEAAST